MVSEVKTANYQLPPPEAMICTSDVVTNWKDFKVAYEDYAIATELTSKEDAIQARMLETVMGKDYRQILSRLGLTEVDMKKSSEILDKLQTYFAPTKSIPTIQETEDRVLDKNEELLALKHIGTVKHKKKGQFYAPLCFTHAEGNTIVDCQLDAGATCNVMSLKSCTLTNHHYSQKPHN